MTTYHHSRIASLLLFIGASAFGSLAGADEAEDLTATLHEFLAGVSEAAVHDRFWAEDLVYTSSRGTRTSKADIMQGFTDSDDDGGDESGPIYSAEDIRIQVFGSTAVVAFRLVATPLAGPDSAAPAVAVQHYFNTGTFVLRDGRWQVVAWQATVIPDS
jgi:hypothetical protein